jgi:phage-related protein
MLSAYIGTPEQPLALKIHDLTAYNDIWLQSVDGLDSPDYRITENARAGEDGSIIASQFYGSRTITLEGKLKGDSPQVYEDNRFNFSQAFAINKDVYGVPQPIRLTFTTLSGYTYFIDCFVARRPTFSSDVVLSTDFQVQLIAPTPLVYGETEVVSAQFTRPTGGGFILPVIFPIVSDSLVGGSVVVNNNGNAAVLPTITLRGTMSNPYIQNDRAGGVYMQLNYTLGLTDVVVIDMAKKTVVLNDTTPLLGVKNDLADWWGIDPGNNTISFSTSDTSDTGTCEIKFQPGYIGI